MKNNLLIALLLCFTVSVQGQTEIFNQNFDPQGLPGVINFSTTKIGQFNGVAADGSGSSVTVEKPNGDHYLKFVRGSSGTPYFVRKYLGYKYTPLIASPPVFGALISAKGSNANGLTPEQVKTAVAKSLGIIHLREAIILDKDGFNGSNNSYDVPMYDAGFKMALNINNSSPIINPDDSRSPVPFPTDVNDPNSGYQLRLKQALDGGPSRASQIIPSLLVIENEETNQTYYDYSVTPLSAYVAELQAAIPIAHARDLKVANAGITAEYMRWLTFNYMVIQNNPDSTNFKTKAAPITRFNNATFVAKALNIRDNLLRPYYSKYQFNANKTVNKNSTNLNCLDLDYINMHYYAYGSSTNNGTSYNISTADDAYLFRTCLQQLKDMTGKTVITNEFGQYDTDPATTAAILQVAYDEGLPYAIWYSGPAGDRAIPLHSSSAGTLTNLGLQYRSTAANNDVNYKVAKFISVDMKISVPTTTTSHTGDNPILIGNGFSVDSSVGEADSITAKLGINLVSTGSTNPNWKIHEYTNTNSVYPAGSTYFNGEQELKWYINTSGSTVTYTPPKTGASTESLAAGTWDLWVKTASGAASTWVRAWSDKACQNGTRYMADIKFLFDSGSATITYDDIIITKEVSLNGAITYSPFAEAVITSLTNPEEELKIYSSPQESNVKLFFTAANEGNAKASVFDLSGRQVLSQDISLVKGSNVINMPSQLQNGLYVMQLETANKTFVKKFVK